MFLIRQSWFCNMFVMWGVANSGLNLSLSWACSNQSFLSFDVFIGYLYNENGPWYHWLVKALRNHFSEDCNMKNNTDKRQYFNALTRDKNITKQFSTPKMAFILILTTNFMKSKQKNVLFFFNSFPLELSLPSHLLCEIYQESSATSDNQS